MLASAVTFWRWLTNQPMPLDATGQADDADDRRVWLRFRASLNVRCDELGAEAETGVFAVIRDISRGGVQIVAPCRFEPGTVLSVELPAIDGRTALAALACVVRAQPHGDSEWAMGCRFSCELNDEQLQAFGATRVRTPSSDPRIWSRFGCDATAVYQRIGDKDHALRPARVRNIAAAGMALLVAEEVPAGELLSTELHDANGRPVVTILACVVRVQTTSEGQLLGCNFIRETQR